MASAQSMNAFYFDRQFLVAMALGPCVWLALYLLLSPVRSPLDIKLLVMVCAVYPVLEELAFRGFLQSWLLEKRLLAKTPVVGISYANLMTSILFAAAHLYSQSPVWAFLVFFPSLVFGYCRERFDGVLPSIVLHCWYNLGFFLLLM